MAPNRPAELASLPWDSLRLAGQLTATAGEDRKANASKSSALETSRVAGFRGRHRNLEDGWGSRGRKPVSRIHKSRTLPRH